jgi:hypothetical protein
MNKRQTSTGLGFHYFPDDAHYRATDLQTWLPELKSLGTSWLTLVGSPARAIPESFLRPIVEAGIEPIIHLPVTPIRAVDLDDLRVLYESYARWGAHYVVLYDRPNTRAAWQAGEWGREGLIDHFLDWLLPPLQLAQDSGLAPVFPPLQQIGDYWDTSFLDKALALLKQRGQDRLLKDLAFGFYGFTGNRPLEWGAGGPARWPDSRPYNTPPGSQNQGGFRAFEWYADVITAHLGQARPLLMLAGGALPGDAADPGYPPVDADRHAYCNSTIAKAMMERTLPDYVINVSFWLLAAADNSPHAPVAWRRNDGAALPAVEALRQLVRSQPASRERVAYAKSDAVGEIVRSKASPDSGQAAPGGADSSMQFAERALPPLSEKPIYHYLLLPSFEGGNSDWHLLAAMDYVRKFQPACGFSVAEAKAAEHVTIVGSEQGISAEAEHALRSAGCWVERVCGEDGAKTQRRLSEMASAGKRFLAD